MSKKSKNTVDWSGCQRWLPMSGKSIVVISGSDTPTALLPVHNNCIIFAPQTVFSHCVRSDDGGSKRATTVFRPKGLWEIDRRLHVNDRMAIEAFQRIVNLIEATEVGLVIMPEAVRSSIKRHFAPRFTIPPVTAKRAHLLIMNFDGTNSFTGMSCFAPAHN